MSDDFQVLAVVIGLAVGFTLGGLVIGVGLEPTSPPAWAVAVTCAPCVLLTLFLIAVAIYERGRRRGPRDEVGA